MAIFVPKRVPMEILNLERKIRERLAEADINNNGCYTEEELKKALKDLGSYVPGWRAKRCLVKADDNKDGQISGEEIETLVDYLLGRALAKHPI